MTIIKNTMTASESYEAHIGLLCDEKDRLLEMLRALSRITAVANNRHDAALDLTSAEWSELYDVTIRANALIDEIDF